MAAAVPIWWLILLWHKLTGRGRADRAWVISGHRGRLCVDNAKALFDYISQHTEQPIIWIGNEHSPDGLTRGSWKARLAIARAPALIYSHGEDDLDPFLVACRRLLATRIYIGHGANLLKRGTMHPEVLQGASPVSRFVQRLVATDYDLLLCHSALEQQFWNNNLPHNHDKHMVSGGPRLDVLLGLASRNAEQRIVWFPTFRDSANGKRELGNVLRAVSRNEALKGWLGKFGHCLDIGLHINQSPESIIETGNPQVTVFQAEELADRLAGAQLLITDYSSAMIDWLVFDRPVICFPFDKSDYLSNRGLHLPYEDYVYGPIVHSTDELVDTLLSENWRDGQESRQRRSRLRDKFLPGLTAGNAAACYDTIRRHLGQHGCRPETAMPR